MDSFLYFLGFLGYIINIMGNNLKNDLFKIVYIGNKEDFTLNLFGYITHTFDKGFPYQKYIISPTKLDSKEIFKIKPHAIFYEVGIEEPKLKKIIKVLNEYYYPENCLTIGLFNNLSSDTQACLKFINPNLSFKLTTKGEEIKFISNALISVLKPEYSIQKSFAIAKPSAPCDIKIPIYLKEVSTEKITIETPFKLTLNKLKEINNEFLSTMLINNKDVKYIGTDEYVEYIMNKYSTHFETNFVLDKEIINLKEKINKFLAERKEFDDFKKEKIYNKFLSDKTFELINNKKHLFFNWYKKNPYNRKTSNKKNVILISKNYAEMKLDTALAEEYNIIIFKGVNKENLNKIKYLNPDFILWDLEIPLKEVNRYGVIEEKIVDICQEDNYFKSLIYLKDFFGLENLSEVNKLIIFSDEELINKDVIMQEIGGLTIELVKKKASPSIINQTLQLLLKNKKNKDEKTKKQNQPEKETPDNVSVFFHPFEKLSLGTATIPVSIEYLTESEIIIESGTELPYFQKIFCRLNNININFSIIPNKKLDMDNKTGISKKYHGIIHCLTEEERKIIRAYVIKHENQMKRAS